MMKLAVLASGRGSNFKAVLDHVRAGRIDAEIALVLSNEPAAPALRIAAEAGIPVWGKAHRSFPSRAAFDAAMLAAMRKAGVEGVALAGYMRLLSPEFVAAYSGRILNIHPSLLPAFPGVRGGGDALEYGVRLAGCTAHFVVEATDAGPVIIQAALPVLETDTEESLMERVHGLEHRIYPQAVAWFAAGRLRLEGRTVRLLPPKTAAPAVPSIAPETPSLIHPPLETGF